MWAGPLVYDNDTLRLWSVFAVESFLSEHAPILLRVQTEGKVTVTLGHSEAFSGLLEVMQPGSVGGRVISTAAGMK